MPKSKAVNDQAFVDAVAQWPKDGKLPSTGNLRDQINEEHGENYDRKTIYRRLHSLESEGKIRKVEVGMGRGRSVGWAPSDFQLSMVERTESTAASVLPLAGITTGNIFAGISFSLSVGFLVYLLGWVSLVWGLPFLLWTGITWLDARPDKELWAAIQPAGLLWTVFITWIAKPLIGVGPGIGNAPEVWTGVDVTLGIIAVLVVISFGALCALAVRRYVDLKSYSRRVKA